MSEEQTKIQKRNLDLLGLGQHKVTVVGIPLFFSVTIKHIGEEKMSLLKTVI